MKTRLASKVAGAVFLGLAIGLATSGGGSFSNLDFELGESKQSLHGMAEENLLLKTQLREAQKAIQSLSNSLTLANREAESYQKESAELKLTMEALGVDGIGADHRKLEQRLLKAVADLKLLQKEKDTLTEELVRFGEAVLQFTRVASTEDGEALAAVESALRRIPSIVSGVSQQEWVESGSISSGVVISIKEELSLVVANVGATQGVKVGMPFRVYRGDQPIGHARAVDVREKICGAVIQSLDIEENKIKVGDRLKVDAR